MSIFGLTPIILLVFIVGIVVLVVVRTKRIRLKSSKFSYVKRVKWMFTAYMTLLLVSAGAFYVLPNDTSLMAEETAPDISLYELADKGKIGSVDRSYIKETWEYNSDGSELNLKTSSPNEMPIFVEVKDVLQQTVEVAYYQTPIIIEGINFSNRVHLPHIDFSNNNMTVTEPEPVEVNLGTYKESFIASQFNEKGWMDGAFSSSDATRSNQHLLYIQIPEDIDINYDQNVFVEFVGEGDG
ncbi:hypothetical protein [Virgibacillus sp. JSM 102003]|uniref:hypothetical protein n=1 Tax=Virgibacillus sp. JSM 102003 TaxID=1562108 RepID=UPI0035BF8854